MFCFEILVDKIGRLILLTNPCSPLNLGDFLTLFGEVGNSFSFLLKSGFSFVKIGFSLCILVISGLEKTVCLVLFWNVFDLDMISRCSFSSIWLTTSESRLSFWLSFLNFWSLLSSSSCSAYPRKGETTVSFVLNSSIFSLEADADGGDYSSFKVSADSVLSMASIGTHPTGALFSSSYSNMLFSFKVVGWFNCLNEIGEVLFNWCLRLYKGLWKCYFIFIYLYFKNTKNIKLFGN